ncbi:hypothetical protein [Actinoplanes sp. HUAS TT8]|uniref:hypothetical protein n=1 Tax=Actinoplanes sp. HUAS TT8 TaxID=3447453 RepID=UPI003F51CAA7
MPPDPRKPRLAAAPRVEVPRVEVPRVEVPRQRQGSAVHDARPLDSPGSTPGRLGGRETEGYYGGRHGGDEQARSGSGWEEWAYGGSGWGEQARNEPYVGEQESGRGGTGGSSHTPAPSGSELEGYDAMRSSATGGPALGRASVPRPRHSEANVGRAGNLTPGQRHRTVCNDPFKYHLHRRRDPR